MSINASGTNYVSNFALQAWMEEKTEGLYGKLRDSMDVSNDRADAESALNDIKNELLQMKTNGKGAQDVGLAIHDAIDKYGAEFPEVKKVLEDFATTLDDRAQAAAYAAAGAPGMAQAIASGTGGRPSPWATTPATSPAPASHVAPVPVKLTNDEIDAWTKAIGDRVDDLGKKDQLGLINIQEFNAQINQAKQTASALMDASDKAANAIINHIA